MKKLFAIIMACLTAAACCFALTACGSKKEKLYVYTNAGFAPYEYVNEYGEVVGIDIDVMQEIGEILGYEVVVNDIEFSNILSEVQKNKLAVGAAGMSKKAERDEVALASNVYATSQQYVIAPKGTFAADAVVTEAEIYAAVGDKKIGVQKGTTGSFLISDYLDTINVAYEDKVIDYSNAIVASSDINSTLKAVIIDELPAKAISEDNENLECWKIDAEMESYVLYFNKEATELVAKVNKILDIMQVKGENGISVIDYFTMKHTGGIVG